MTERVGIVWIVVIFAWSTYTLVSLVHLAARQVPAFWRHIDIAGEIAVMLLALWWLTHG